VNDDGSLTPEPFDITPYQSLASYWVPEAGLDQLAAEPVVGAWLVTKTTALTEADKTTLFESLLRGLEAKTEQPPQSSGGLRRNTTLIGAAVTLAILALTVSLLRAESSNDDQVLLALGAEARTRRRIATATTGFLALGGAVLALPTGYLALIAIMSDRGAGFPFVIPVVPLASLLVGTPIVAAIATYLLAGRSTQAPARSI